MMQSLSRAELASLVSAAFGSKSASIVRTATAISTREPFTNPFSAGYRARSRSTVPTRGELASLASAAIGPFAGKAIKLATVLTLPANENVTRRWSATDRKTVERSLS